MSDWISFYDFKHSVIYVNARHRDVHYRTIAEDIRDYVPSPAAHVLDYGCGEATSADLVAAACGQLMLVEAAPNVRAALTARYAGKIRRSPCSRPSKPRRCRPARFDLIVHAFGGAISHARAELDRPAGDLSASCSSQTAC